MSNKVTKRELFTTIMDYVARADNFGTETLSKEKALEMLEHEIELLNRKNSSDRKPTAQQVQNAIIADAIHAGMEDGRLYTVTEVLKEIEECNELSNQKVSRIMSDMAKAGRLEKVEEKRKTFYRVVRG